MQRHQVMQIQTWTQRWNGARCASQRGSASRCCRGCAEQAWWTGHACAGTSPRWAGHRQPPSGPAFWTEESSVSSNPSLVYPRVSLSVFLAYLFAFSFTQLFVCFCSHSFLLLISPLCLCFGLPYIFLILLSYLKYCNKPMREIQVTSPESGYWCHKSSATHSYQCVKHLCVSEPWHASQFSGFSMCTQTPMDAIAHWVCANTVIDVCTQSWPRKTNPVPYWWTVPALILHLAFWSDTSATEL